MKRAVILLAQGTEEVEALMPVDLLRRAGIEVTMVSVTGQLEVTGSHNISITTDALLDSIDVADYDMLILPGGMPGTLHLQEDVAVQKMIMRFSESGKYLAAICAAPKIYGGLGLLKGRKATCYPGFEEELSGAQVVYEEVVADGPFITSRGLGTAIPFSLKLIESLISQEVADEIAEKIIYS